MSAFQTIETGIPFPRMDGRRTKRQRHYAEPPLKTRWDLLRVGNSVVVKHATDRQAAYQWAMKHGRLFTCAKLGKGYRIWRVA